MEQLVYLVLINLQDVHNVLWVRVLHATRQDIWPVPLTVVYVTLVCLGVRCVRTVLPVLCVRLGIIHRERVLLLALSVQVNVKYAALAMPAPPVL